MVYGVTPEFLLCIGGVHDVFKVEDTKFLEGHKGLRLCFVVVCLELWWRLCIRVVLDVFKVEDIKVFERHKGLRSCLVVVGLVQEESLIDLVGVVDNWLDQ